MKSFRLNENDDQDTNSIPKSDETLQTEEEQIGFPPWSQLPAPVIETIYSFLNRSDQRNMSLVCRNWRQEYSSPALWRRMEFRFPVLGNNTELLCPDVILARRYGAMFRHVKIVLKKLNTATIRDTYISVNANRQLKLFSQAVMDNSQLLSICFDSLYNFRSVPVHGLLSSASGEILSLLKSQNRLRRVEFDFSQFGKAEAAEILNVIFANLLTTLRHLSLRQFVYEQPGEEFMGSIVNDELNFLAFINLEILEMDYFQMFVSLILSFYEYSNRADMKERKGSLKEIRLEAYYIEEFNFVRINPLVWKYYRNIFPDLRIEYKLYCPCDLSILNTFIVPHMPLRSLQFYWQDNQIISLLRHITSCELNKCLEEFFVNWGVVSPSFAPDLISFINICPKLKTLELQIQHPVEAAPLETVFNSLKENRPASLAIVKITMVANEEEMTHAHLNDIHANLNTYVSLLQPLELKLSVLVRS